MNIVATLFAFASISNQFYFMYLIMLTKQLNAVDEIRAYSRNFHLTHYALSVLNSTNTAKLEIISYT